MRNITDSFTNHVTFSADQVRDWLPQLVDPDGTPPPSFWPTYLHEATHHWCFSSPVQTVVMLLRARSHIQALLALETDSVEERRHWELRAAEDLFRSEMVQELMRPLAEGMATFAEFDLKRTMRSGLLVAPLRWAARFAGEGPHDLLFTRLDGQVSRRKESLLAQPLSCSNSEGYLAGYLTIKMMWLRLNLNRPDFWTSTNFIEAIYSRFYEDEDLVALLLDQREYAPDSMSTIGQYIGLRIQGTFGVQDNQMLAEHIERRRAAGDGALRFNAPLVSENVGTGFAAMWDRVFADVPINLTDYSRKSNELARHYTMIMHSRDLMLLGTVACNLDVRDGRATVSIDGVETTVLPAGKAPDGEAQAATLLVYLGTRGGQRVVVATSEAALCYRSTPEWSTGPVWSLNPAIADDKDHALEGMVLGRLGLALVEDILESHRTGINELRELSRAPGYREQHQQFLDRIYRICTMLDVPEEQLDEVWTRMREDGFYGLFDRDADAVRALSLVGILSSAGVLGDLTSEYEKLGLDRSSALATLTAFAKRYGMYRIVDGTALDDPFQNVVYCSV